MMKKIIFGLLLIMCFLVVGVTANDEIPIINTTTETTIQWNWNNTFAPIGVTQLSIDGYIVWNYDAYTNEFILSDLTPNTTHTIIIYSGENISANTATTKIPPKTEQDKFLGFVNIYIIVAMCAIFAILGIAIPICGIGCCIFAIIGLGSSVNNTFAMGLLFFIFLIVGAVEALSNL